jgi:hypothetical protein
MKDISSKLVLCNALFAFSPPLARSLALHFKRPIKHKKYHYQALLALASAATHSSKGEQIG